MKGTTGSGSGDDSPPGKARSPLGRKSLEGHESGEISDRAGALGPPPPQTLSAIREGSEEAFLPVLEHLSGHETGQLYGGEEEDVDDGMNEEDTILSEDSIDSTVLGIVDRCKREEDNIN
ncbi:diguanylate cyclase [Lasius niger]|uniref:Diguanylate cyclase n=1 Tax=Lasius niger TaxID=67767 RepID=A0A0J7NAM6_LASNI|nr:diguanylate cyclase [Lasius niger]